MMRRIGDTYNDGWQQYKVIECPTCGNRARIRISPSSIDVIECRPCFDSAKAKLNVSENQNENK